MKEKERKVKSKMPEQTKQSLIRMVLKVHREKFYGRTEEELRDTYYYLVKENELFNPKDTGVKGLRDMTMSELIFLLIDLNTEGKYGNDRGQVWK